MAALRTVLELYLRHNLTVSDKLPKAAKSADCCFSSPCGIDEPCPCAAGWQFQRDKQSRHWVSVNLLMNEYVEANGVDRDKDTKITHPRKLSPPLRDATAFASNGAQFFFFFANDFVVTEKLDTAEFTLAPPRQLSMGSFTTSDAQVPATIRRHPLNTSLRGARAYLPVDEGRFLVWLPNQWGNQLLLAGRRDRSCPLSNPDILLEVQTPPEFRNATAVMTDPLGEHRVIHLLRGEHLHTHEFNLIMRLQIRIPSATHLSGQYEIDLDQRPNGHPLYKKLDADYFLYVGTDNLWYINGITARNANFNCARGFVHHPHAASLSLQPEHLQAGQWRRYVNHRWQVESTIVVERELSELRLLGEGRSVAICQDVADFIQPLTVRSRWKCVFSIEAPVATHEHTVSVMTGTKKVHQHETREASASVGVGGFVAGFASATFSETKSELGVSLDIGVKMLRGLIELCNMGASYTNESTHRESSAGAGGGGVGLASLKSSMTSSMQSTIWKEQTQEEHKVTVTPRQSIYHWQLQLLGLSANGGRIETLVPHYRDTTSNVAPALPDLRTIREFCL